MTFLPGALLVSRLVLAAVFVLAGVTKLLDRKGLRDAMRGFGVPDGLTGPFAVLLPAVELTIALLLLPQLSAWLGGIAALTLLSIFTAGIVANLIRGRKPDCHCFGQLHSEPIGSETITRNALLIGLSTFVVVAGRGDAGPGALAWLTAVAPGQELVVLGEILGLALLGWQIALLSKVSRQTADLGRRVEPDANHVAVAAPAMAPAPPSIQSAPILPTTAGLPLGRQAPAFALTDLDGSTITLDALRGAGQPVVLVFSDPDCGPCTVLLPEIARWQRDHAGVMTLALVSRGTPGANTSKVGDAGVQRVLLQRDREVANAFDVVGTPSAVLIHVDGRIGSLLAQGETEIRQLVKSLASAGGGAVDTASSAAPMSAPDFVLDDLDGGRVALADYRGKDTLLLFWNTTCSHCQKMLPELQRFEAKPIGQRAQLVVISTGSVEANRALNLKSPVLIDSTFSIGLQYAVQGTPSGVLVGADGRIAAPLAVGAAPIFALVSHTPAGSEIMQEVVQLVTTLPPGTRPVRLNCVHDELLPDGSLILYNGCRREVMTLNATAALAWEYCDGETDVETIVAEVQSVFPEAADVDRDVRDLLDRLLRAGAIAPSGGLPEDAAKTLATT